MITVNNDRILIEFKSGIREGLWCVEYDAGDKEHPCWLVTRFDIDEGLTAVPVKSWTMPAEAMGNDGLTEMFADLLGVRMARAVVRRLPQILADPERETI